MNLHERVSRLYFKRFGDGVDVPCRYRSDEESRDGKDYYVLRNVNGVLAVYRLYDTSVRYAPLVHEEMRKEGF